MRRTLSLVSIALFALGCGDDSATGTSEGTGSGGGSDAEPGITKADCPGAPEALTLAQPAPYWFGLETVQFTVPGGVPSNVQSEILDPVLGSWSSSYGGLRELEGGGYLVPLSVSPTEENKDGSFKIRVRALLDGCPPSDWVGTEAFQLSDPLADTSWTMQSDPVDTYLQFYAYPEDPTETATGPYTLTDAGVAHSMTFHADGTLDETYELGLESAHSGDVYDGCTFVVHYTALWHYDFSSYSSVVVTHRRVAAMPLDGSACSKPSLSAMRINQPSFAEELANGQLSPSSIDYDRLLYNPPGKVTWSEGNLVSSMQQILGALAVDTPGAAVQVNGYTSFTNPRHVKQ